MRPTIRTVAHLGISASRSPPSCVWHRKAGSPGPVLDAGCGTGDNTLHIASLGLSVLGVDVAESALAIARQKAAGRGMDVEFAAADALQLERLGRKFATVLDCGMFHTCDADERSRYVASLASVTEHGGTLNVLCFSDEGFDPGPHPVSQRDLRAGVQIPAPDGISPLSNETEFKPDTTTTARRLGSRKSNESKPRVWSWLGDDALIARYMGAWLRTAQRRRIPLYRPPSAAHYGALPAPP